MMIHRGTSTQDAIKIPFKIYEQHQVEYKINEYIDQMFGGTDGDYFVMSNQLRKDINGKQFKILLVEDRDQIKHSVYFELIQLDKTTTIR